MAIARFTHFRLSIPLSGAPPGKVPESCFPGVEIPVAQPRPRRVSFAEEVTTFDTEASPVSSPTTDTTGGGRNGGGYSDVGG